MSHTAVDDVDRPLTAAEHSLVRWMLEHGSGDNSRFIAQLETARVAGLCGCGCASIDFSVNGVRPHGLGITVLSDYQWLTQNGNRCGAFVFAEDGLLAGLDLWSMDGYETPSSIPRIDDLISYDGAGAEHESG